VQQPDSQIHSREGLQGNGNQPTICAFVCMCGNLIKSKFQLITKAQPPPPPPNPLIAQPKPKSPTRRMRNVVKRRFSPAPFGEEFLIALPGCKCYSVGVFAGPQQLAIGKLVHWGFSRNFNI